MSAFEQIRKNHRKRHSHEERNTERFNRCKSFISVPSDATGDTRIKCTACGLWQLKYVPTKTATAD